MQVKNEIGEVREKYPIPLPKEKIDQIFEEAETQGDYISAFWRLAYPDLDKIVPPVPFALASDTTCTYIHIKAREFDLEAHPDVFPGGGWLNWGYAIEANMSDWEILQNWHLMIEDLYPRYDTDPEEKCPKCGAFLQHKIELDSQGEEILTEIFCPQECSTKKEVKP